MDKQEPPQSFGVFKPVGHTVIVLRTAQDLDTAARALLAVGFGAEALSRYTPAEMLAQADADLVSASPLAAFGQELNLVKAQRAWAEEGCSFLVVHAATDEEAALVDSVLQGGPAVAAQRYGRLLIEELVDTPPGTQQVRESLDTGLDPGLEPGLDPGKDPGKDAGLDTGRGSQSVSTR